MYIKLKDENLHYNYDLVKQIVYAQSFENNKNITNDIEEIIKSVIKVFEKNCITTCYKQNMNLDYVLDDSSK